MHSSLIGKVEKANRYARELDRITIDRLALTFRGDNDTHHVSLDAGQWHCTCHYFDSWRTCVHVLSLQKIMGVMLPEEAQESIFSAQAGRPRLTAAGARRPDHRRGRRPTRSAPFAICSRRDAGSSHAMHDRRRHATAPGPRRQARSGCSSRPRRRTSRSTSIGCRRPSPDDREPRPVAGSSPSLDAASAAARNRRRATCARPHRS